MDADLTSSGPVRASKESSRRPRDWTGGSALSTGAAPLGQPVPLRPRDGLRETRSQAQTRVWVEEWEKTDYKAGGQWVGRRTDKLESRLHLPVPVKYPDTLMINLFFLEFLWVGFCFSCQWTEMMTAADGTGLSELCWVWVCGTHHVPGSVLGAKRQFQRRQGTPGGRPPNPRRRLPGANSSPSDVRPVRQMPAGKEARERKGGVGGFRGLLAWVVIPVSTHAHCPGLGSSGDGRLGRTDHLSNRKAVSHWTWACKLISNVFLHNVLLHKNQDFKLKVTLSTLLKLHLNGFGFHHYAFNSGLLNTRRSQHKQCCSFGRSKCPYWLDLIHEQNASVIIIIS